MGGRRGTRAADRRMMERLTGKSPSLECTPRFQAPSQSHISSGMNDTITVFFTRLTGRYSIIAVFRPYPNSFCTDIHGPQRMNHNDLGALLT